MEKILVIDDDKDILELVSLILNVEKISAVVTSDTSGLEELVRRERPAMILMDIWMPLHDGRDLCKKLKDIFPHLSVWLFSANKIASESILKCGADGFISKPFDIKSLIETIRKTFREYHLTNTQLTN